jgi:hypothetical protein
VKREAEALHRAYLNMRSAHDEIMQRQDAAFEKMMDAFSEFSAGHHQLFANLDSKVKSALSTLQRDLTRPPPLPHNEVFDRFEQEVRDFENGQQLQ